MPGKGNLDIGRIVVSPGRVEKDAYWEFQHNVTRGAIYHYTALDANERLPLPWWFVVQIPGELLKGEYILLQTLDYPRTKAWTPVARMVINFGKATMAAYRGFLYAKVRLADPEGAQKYVTWQHRRALPPYLTAFDLRPKKRVATTRGSDAETLVAVVPRDDHACMIRLFFATKVWPLERGLPAATRKALAGVASR